MSKVQLNYGFNYDNFFMRLSLLFLTTFVAAFSFAATDYRPYVLGDWQCQTSVTTQFGDSSVLGDIALHDDNRMIGNGNLLLSYPGITTELPLAATLDTQWSFKNNRILVSKMSGDIVSPYPLLNGIANSFKQDILKVQTVSFRLSKVGKKYMALLADDNTEILCIRPNAAQK